MNDVLRTEALSQPLIFQKLRGRLFRNALRTALGQSPIRLLTIFFCSLVVWAGVYTASHVGFVQIALRDNLPLFGGMVGLTLDLFFFSLTILLLFSGGIILYGSLFSSAESRFLLATPAHADQVFAYKFQGAIAFSSWAFVLLGSPVLVAFGVVAGAPWYFYVVLALYFVGFVLIPGSLGALVCLAVANCLPRRPKHFLV